MIKYEIKTNGYGILIILLNSKYERKICIISMNKQNVRNNKVFHIWVLISETDRRQIQSVFKMT